MGTSGLTERNESCKGSSLLKCERLCHSIEYYVQLSITSLDTKLRETDICQGLGMVDGKGVGVIIKGATQGRAFWWWDGFAF